MDRGEPSPVRGRMVRTIRPLTVLGSPDFSILVDLQENGLDGGDVVAGCRYVDFVVFRTVSIRDDARELDSLGHRFLLLPDNAAGPQLGLQDVVRLLGGAERIVGGRRIGLHFLDPRSG